jgi:hypothetical protein
MSTAQIVREYFSEEVWDIIFDALGEHIDSCFDDDERRSKIENAREKLYELHKITKAKVR